MSGLSEEPELSGKTVSRAGGVEAQEHRLAEAPAVRSQKKFPRPVRLAIWFGAPAVLWGGVYLIWRGLN
ncbi:MAG: hypothetical protein GC147_07905 [Porphyrobacter sp.]|nr:hypothetical protein [Porphyrobacter sp.]